MPKFEVHIPAAEPGGFNMTLKVGADNWMSALKAGMQKLGEQGAVSANVMVDIQEDNSIHITESGSGRVFRIRELSEEEAATAPVKRPSGIRRAPVAAAAAPSREVKTEPAVEALERPASDQTLPPLPAMEVTQPNRSAEAPKEHEGKTVPVGPASVPAAARAKKPQPPAPGATSTERPVRAQTKSQRIELVDVEELERPVKPVVGSIGRAKSTPDALASIRQQTDELLAEVFMQITELEKKTSIDEAMQFILDVAMEKVKCEAGSVLRADASTGDLTFVVARGPAAKELLQSKITIPASTGIAGFCASEGVSVALSDAQQDPRFLAEIGQKVDYQTRSMLCAPMMTHGRSFGCVQLINRAGGAQFLEHEVGVLAYLAHQAALYLNDRI